MGGLRIGAQCVTGVARIVTFPAAWQGFRSADVLVPSAASSLAVAAAAGGLLPSGMDSAGLAVAAVGAGAPRRQVVDLRWPAVDPTGLQPLLAVPALDPRGAGHQIDGDAAAVSPNPGYAINLAASHLELA